MNIAKSTWACRKRLLSFFIMATAVLTASSQTYPPKDSPQLEFALQLRVHISEPYTIGETAHGRRIVIPITGGSFEGPSLKGTILSGGADYQLANADGTRTELEAIYSIRTDDGVNIHVRNRGLVCDGKNADGTPYYYFKAAPQFEAPKDSRYAWLNDALFVCAPEWTTEFKGIVLNVWKVK
ncbi:MAG: DUF3237 domain-containing protein [Prevotella sp.]|jgi:hypothetical protein|nr:DUF3237 domain-containing protein [Prevotella sp.]